MDAGTVGGERIDNARYVLLILDQSTKLLNLDNFSGSPERVCLMFHSAKGILRSRRGYFFEFVDSKSHPNAHHRKTKHADI